MADDAGNEKSVFDNLKPHHKLFIENYIACLGNGTHAYLQTYHIKKNNTAAASASRLLKNPNIMKALDEKYCEIWKNKNSDLEKTKTYLMIHAIGESDITDVVEFKNAIRIKELKDIPIAARHSIQSIESIEKIGKDGCTQNIIKIKMHPKLEALKFRAKIQGMTGYKIEDDMDIIVSPSEKPQKLIEMEEKTRLEEEFNL